jgi:hypothetical protein
MHQKNENMNLLCKITGSISQSIKNERETKMLISLLDVTEDREFKRTSVEFI